MNIGNEDKVAKKEDICMQCIYYSTFDVLQDQEFLQMSRESSSLAYLGNMLSVQDHQSPVGIRCSQNQIIPSKMSCCLPLNNKRIFFFNRVTKVMRSFIIFCQYFPTCIDLKSNNNSILSDKYIFHYTRYMSLLKHENGMCFINHRCHWFFSKGLNNPKVTLAKKICFSIKLTPFGRDGYQGWGLWKKHENWARAYWFPWQRQPSWIFKDIDCGQFLHH